MKLPATVIAPSGTTTAESSDGLTTATSTRARGNMTMDATTIENELI